VHVLGRLGDSLWIWADQTSCVALGQQWVPGITYHDKNGQVTRTTQGQCETKCSAKIPSRCHSRSMCEGIDHQWIPSTCCGTGCGQYSAGHEAGSCQEKCTLERPYECHTQVCINLCVCSQQTAVICIARMALTRLAKICIVLHRVTNVPIVFRDMLWHVLRRWTAKLYPGSGYPQQQRQICSVTARNPRVHAAGHALR
jgi:hypothetical protein